MRIIPLIFLCILTCQTIYSQQLAVPTALSANSGAMVSTAPDSRGWTDPALNHNKLLQQTDGKYVLVGNFKVIGSPFLLGERHKTDMYSVQAKALNIYINYNTYSQEIEFYSSSNPTQPLAKEPGTVDSFVIQRNVEREIAGDMKFLYGPHIGSKEKVYFQEICKGSKYTLYKKYRSDLSYSSSNLGQTELRQFDLIIEYYYSDSGTKALKKIKPNAASLIREFKDVHDLSRVISTEDFTIQPENAFCKAFAELNKEK